LKKTYSSAPQHHPERSRKKSQPIRAQELAHKRYYEALLALIHAVSHLPELIGNPLQEGKLPLPLTITVVSQYLVNIIHEALDCERVVLFSLEQPSLALHYLAMSGFTPEQTRKRMESDGLMMLPQMLEEDNISRLFAGQEYITTYDHIHFPFEEKVLRKRHGVLCAPIFCNGQLSGGLVITRIGSDYRYTPEEVELVRAISDLTDCIVECVAALNTCDGTHAKKLILETSNHLINEFLTLAAHELRTPLTTVMGNVQLAQRRLQRLKQEVTEHPDTALEQIEQIQSLLESAIAGTRVQRHVIENLLDEAQIQSNTFQLVLRPCNLIDLVQESVEIQRRQAPKNTILLHISPLKKTIPITADAARIRQVISTYLANALAFSPQDRPITVDVSAKKSVAQVSVHHEGPGIPSDEQSQVWERFYQTRNLTIAHERDLSGGINLYLCRELIRRHRGTVGLQSTPELGTTFSLALPLKNEASTGL
jgi:signal transduction histidine kinase